MDRRVWAGLVFVAVTCVIGIAAHKSPRAAVVPDIDVGEAGSNPTMNIGDRQIGGRNPLGAYRNSMGGLFGTADPIQKPKGSSIKTAPGLSQAQPPDPLVDYVFTGMVTLDGREYALIENRSTHEGEYVAVGEVFHGFRVSSIEKDGIALSSGNEPRRLALNDNFSLAPLATKVDSAAGQITQMASEGLIRGSALAVTMQRIALLDWIGQDGEKMKDQVFEGQMSVEEYNQKVGSQPAATLFLSVKLMDAGELAVIKVRDLSTTMAEPTTRLQ